MDDEFKFLTRNKRKSQTKGEYKGMSIEERAMEVAEDAVCAPKFNMMSAVCDVADELKAVIGIDALDYTMIAWDALECALGEKEAIAAPV